MSKDNVKTNVANFEESPDIGLVTYGDDIAVSVSKTAEGKFIINVERIGDNRADVIIEVDGSEPVWEGNLS